MIRIKIVTKDGNSITFGQYPNMDTALDTARKMNNGQHVAIYVEHELSLLESTLLNIPACTNVIRV